MAHSQFLKTFFRLRYKKKYLWHLKQNIYNKSLNLSTPYFSFFVKNLVRLFIRKGYKETVENIIYQSLSDVKFYLFYKRVFCLTFSRKSISNQECFWYLLRIKNLLNKQQILTSFSIFSNITSDLLFKRLSKIFQSKNFQNVKKKKKPSIFARTAPPFFLLNSAYFKDDEEKKDLKKYHLNSFLKKTIHYPEFERVALHNSEASNVRLKKFSFSALIDKYYFLNYFRGFYFFSQSTLYDDKMINFNNNFKESQFKLLPFKNKKKNKIRSFYVPHTFLLSRFKRFSTITKRKRFFYFNRKTKIFFKLPHLGRLSKKFLKRNKRSVFLKTNLGFNHPFFLFYLKQVTFYQRKLLIKKARTYTLLQSLLPLKGVCYLLRRNKSGRFYKKNAIIIQKYYIDLPITQLLQDVLCLLCPRVLLTYHRRVLRRKQRKVPKYVPEYYGVKLVIYEKVFSKLIMQWLYQAICRRKTHRVTLRTACSVEFMQLLRHRSILLKWLLNYMRLTTRYQRQSNFRW